MKKSIIQRIFDGEFYPTEDVSLTDPCYQALGQNISKKIDILTENMNGSTQQVFTQLMDMIQDLHTTEICTFYWAGFRDAMLLVYELFGKGEDKG